MHHNVTSSGIFSSHMKFLVHHNVRSSCTFSSHMKFLVHHNVTSSSTFSSHMKILVHHNVTSSCTFSPHTKFLVRHSIDHPKRINAEKESSWQSIFLCSDWSLVSLTKASTVSITTLRRLLRDRVEHVWALLSAKMPSWAENGNAKEKKKLYYAWGDLCHFFPKRYLQHSCTFSTKTRRPTAKTIHIHYADTTSLQSSSLHN